MKKNTASMDARTDYPVHEFITKRWSPYGFSDQPVSVEDLRSIFEAVRWAPSCFNDQPWHYIVARKEDLQEFEKMRSCLVKANQVWTEFVPVLALSVARLNFSHNNKPNRSALHDMGLAAGNLLLEATSRGLSVHQMIGILPDRVREVYGIPDGFQPMTGIAIGYVGTADHLPENYSERDLKRRPRKDLKDFIFGKNWGIRSEIVES
jgi:nitroreductase